MKNALILHGISNNHTGNWFPWLEGELTQKGYRVWTPDLPNPDMPNASIVNPFIFKNWKFDEESVIIGHSSGAVLALGILQSLPENVVIDSVYLVAGFTHPIGDFEGHRELFQPPFDYKKIQQKARKFVLFHSDNDPYIDISHGEKLRDLLDAQLVVMKRQGHFNLENSPKYTQFPKLLETILST